MVKFIFDLDGTVTSEETLPVIARHFNIEKDIADLTSETVSGKIPFVESFIKRVHMLASLPVDEISAILENASLYSSVYEFILSHKEHCVIATGNLDCWVDRLCSRVGCLAYTSKAEVSDNRVVRLTEILRKEMIVKKYQDRGYAVVFIGEGNNDFEAMRRANISIASGLTHNPANAVLGITDYVIYEEEALCRQLNRLL